MATLIASNYTSTSSSAYGFMALTLPKGTIKNSKTYTLWCRYKWDKNGTASTYPLAMYLYRNTWTNTINFTNAPSDYTTLYKLWTSPADAESYDWYIRCYANGKHNDGVADGAILSMDWYELWEGDAREFSLTDAYRKGTTNLFKHGANPTSLTGIGNNGATVTLDSSTFGYNVYKCVSTAASTQMYIMYNSSALSGSLVTGNTYLATAEIYSPDSTSCNININNSTILASSRTIKTNEWTRVWVIGTRTATGGAVTFYGPAGTYYYKNIHIAETPTSFVELQNSCVNPGYFNSGEQITSLRAWKGYHFETGYNIAVSLSSSSVAASGGTITVTYTITDKNTNAAVSGVTPTVSSTLGTVSNITATNSSGVGTAKVTVASLGTTLKTATTGGTVTVTKSGSGSKTFSQATNKITSITSITPSAGSITAPSTYTAAKNTKTVTTNTNSSCSAVVKFESGSSATTAYASTDYGTWSWQYSWSSNQSYATLTSAHALNMDVTMASRGTTTGAARSATITRTCAWTYTVAAGNSSSGSALTKSGSAGCTATVTQQANAANAYYRDLVVSLSYAAAAPSTTSKTVSPSLTVKATPYYTSGSAGTQITVPSSGYTVSYTESTASSYASVNSSSGVITWNSNAKVTSNRTVGVTANVTCINTYSGLTGSKAATATHTKDSATYSNPTGTLTYPTAAWNSSSSGTWYTPTLTVTQYRGWASGATGTTINPSYTVSYTHGDEGNIHSLNGTTGAVKFVSDNPYSYSRTGAVIATVTANGKTATINGTPKQEGCPGKVIVRQTACSTCTDSGGDIIGVYSYGYAYASITIPEGLSVSKIDWDCKNNTSQGGWGGSSYTHFTYYNNGQYSSETITCTVTFSNNLTVSDFIYISLHQGSSSGGGGGGDSSNDSSNWSLRKSSISNEDYSNSNELINE